MFRGLHTKPKDAPAAVKPVPAVAAKPVSVAPQTASKTASPLSASPASQVVSVSQAHAQDVPVMKQVQFQDDDSDDDATVQEDYGPDRPSFKAPKAIKIHQRKILVVGLTGSGKSRLISAVSGVKGISKGSLCAATKSITHYDGFQLQDVNPESSTLYNVDLFDTVGLGDGEVSTPDILADILSQLSTGLSTVHRVVFCLKLDRLRVRMAEDFRLLYDLFVGLGAQSENLALVVTFCDFHNQLFIKKFMDDVRTQFKVVGPDGADISMFGDEKIRRTYVSFPEIADMDTREDIYPNLKQNMQKKIQESVYAVRSEIIQPDVPSFKPMDNLLLMEEGKYRAFRNKFCKPPEGGFFFSSKGQASGDVAITHAFNFLRPLRAQGA